jgi:hypothetical protein
MASAQPPPPPSARTDLLASLNQGEAITSGLRKVTEAEMTHKNPELRAAEGGPARPPRRATGPAQTALTGRLAN